MLQQFRRAISMLFRYRLHSAFALVGLGIASASVWFISDYVRTSYAYDTFHANHENIYRLTMEITAGGNMDHYATTGQPLGDLLQKNYPGIETYAALAFHSSVVHVNGEVFKEAGLFRANPSLLSVFTFDFLSGDEQSLSNPNSIILSRSLAEKYFGGADATGKQLHINEQTFTVTGIFKDWPKHSHLEINALVSLNQTTAYEAQSWFNMDQYTYVQVANNMDEADLADKLDNLVSEQLAPLIEGSGLSVRFRAQPVQEVYFSPGLVDDVKKGSLIYVHLLGIAGLLVLLVSGLNYINLTLTRSTLRSKEILLKKIFGISRKQLFTQSAIESFVMTLFVALLAAILIIASENLYSSYTGFSSLALIEKLPFLLTTASLIFVFGLAGSGYSGIYLSFSNLSFAKEGNRIRLFKKLLLGFQYGITAVILILTFAMGRQLDFIKNKDLGFAKEGIVILNVPGDEATSSALPQFREQLRSIAWIKHASLVGGGALPGEENGKDLFEVTVDGAKTEKVFNIYRVDEQYFDLLGIEVASGRMFSTDLPSDRTQSVMINEALAKSLNWDDPLKQKISYGGEMKDVIGVVKNFHNKSLHNIIEPIVFQFDQSYTNNVLVRTEPSQANLEVIESTWNKFYPDVPFSLTHFDRFIGSMYEEEQRLTQLFRFFSTVSLILCAMGLFALFSMHVLQKTKEMSIRKVLGADYLNLMKAITKNYSAVVLLSTSMAIPVAWICVSRWLEGFSYHAQTGFGIYFFTVLILVITSLIVIASHIFKILNINPTITLKQE